MHGQNHLDCEAMSNVSLIFLFLSPMAGKESKKARHARLRGYIESLPFDAEIRDQRILEILRHHPNWSLKTNGGKWAIYKKRYFNAWRFEIVDQHGTFRDDISCDVAVRGSLGLKTSPSQRAIVSRAARNSIHRQQILPFRYSQDNPSQDQDVDHVDVNFCELLENWLRTRQQSFEDIRISCPPGRPVGFADGQVEMDWNHYHRQHAKLQLIPQTDHQKITKKRKRSN